MATFGLFQINRTWVIHTPSLIFLSQVALAYSLIIF